jgi:hypothetical protein
LHRVYHNSIKSLYGVVRTMCAVTITLLKVNTNFNFKIVRFASNGFWVCKNHQERILTCMALTEMVVQDHWKNHVHIIVTVCKKVITAKIKVFRSKYKILGSFSIWGHVWYKNLSDRNGFSFEFLKISLLQPSALQQNAVMMNIKLYILKKIKMFNCIYRKTCFDPQ